MNWKDYLMEGTNVLKNKFGITSQEELSKVENTIVVAKLGYLHDYGMTGEFDAKYLCNLHRFLFSDIYEFAGCFRMVDMFKEQTSYLHYEKIPEKLDEVLNYYKNLTVNSDKPFDLARYLADFYRDLIHVHPFRDGNSRTTREFLREYTLDRFHYPLDYSKMDKRNFKLALTEANRYPLLLANEFYEALNLEARKQR